HDQWERPYLSEQARPVLKRMLELHELNDELCWEQVRDDEDERRSPFGLLVEQERARLQLLPAPEVVPERITPPLPVQLPRRRRQTNKKRNPARRVRHDVAVEPPKGERTS